MVYNKRPSLYFLKISVKFNLFSLNFKKKHPLSILYKIGYLSTNLISLILFMIMLSKDSQKLVLSKYEHGEGLTKIFRDLNNFVALSTIERRCKAVRDTGSVNLSSPPGCQRTIRTKGGIQKIKNRLE